MYTLSFYAFLNNCTCWLHIVILQSFSFILFFSLLALCYYIWLFSLFCRTWILNWSFYLFASKLMFVFYFQAVVLQMYHISISCYWSLCILPDKSNVTEYLFFFFFSFFLGSERGAPATGRTINEQPWWGFSSELLKINLTAFNRQLVEFFDELKVRILFYFFSECTIHVFTLSCFIKF